MKAPTIADTERLFLVFVVLLLVHDNGVSGRYLFRPVGTAYYSREDDSRPPFSELSMKRSESSYPNSIIEPSSNGGHRNSGEDNFLGMPRKYTWFKKNSARQQQFLPDLEGKRFTGGMPKKEILFRQCYFNPISCF